MNGNSPRQRGSQMTHDERVLTLLADGQPHTHHELYALHVIAHSRVASLRNKGHNIVAWRDGDDYLYRLVEPTSACEGLADVDSSGGHTLLTEEDPHMPAAPIPDQLALEVAA